MEDKAMGYELNEILTVDEMMELLNVGKNTAYQLLESGEVKAFRIGRLWKIPRKSVYEYIERKVTSV
jgi:excisionase family DNA binding protein